MSHSAILRSLCRCAWALVLILAIGIADSQGQTGARQGAAPPPNSPPTDQLYGYLKGQGRKGRFVPAGELRIENQRVICGQRPTVLDKGLDDLAAAYQGFIILNPDRMARLPLAVKLWGHAQACGHNFRGPETAKADCFAAERGRRQDWLKPVGMLQVCEYLRPTRQSSTRMAGDKRCLAMLACYAGAADTRSPPGQPAEEPLFELYTSYLKEREAGRMEAAGQVVEKLTSLVVKQGGEELAAQLLDGAAQGALEHDLPALAEPFAVQALQLRQAKLRVGHFEEISSLFRLAQVRTALRQHDEARALMARALALFDASEIDGSMTRSLWRSWAWQFADLSFKAKSPAAVAPGEHAEAAFKALQIATETSAAQALSQMSARFGSGDGELARLVRRLQDLSTEADRLDPLLNAAIVNPSAAAEVGRITAARADAEAETRKLRSELRSRFPSYAELATPKPIALGEARRLLRADEALLAYFLSPDLSLSDSFVFAVTPQAVRWLRIEQSAFDVAQRVSALRCGLDQSLWSKEENASWCSILLTRQGETVARGSDGRPRHLPFHLGHAHELYKALLAPVSDMIEGRKLLIVPTGPLTVLPFQVLLTAPTQTALPADPAAYAQAGWLAKRHAVSVLPSAASLRALREHARASAATVSFVGFGNPLLVGPDGQDRRAWSHQTCQQAAPVRLASRASVAAASGLFSRGLAKVDEVRAQYPLPETAEEICAVARAAGAGEGSVFLGEKATESTVKQLSATGALARARIIHFATHGLLSGETETLAEEQAEPALILTPPATPTSQDDGLLTASEIAQLQLDADWVVLSACNTAAGESDMPGAESLSGLARAFFFAGARALLVSHWAVDSEATVRLVTRTFEEIGRDASIGRAEAVRRSMQALIAASGELSHPSTWAPFVVVGEGGH